MATDTEDRGEEDAAYQEYLLDHAERQITAKTYSRGASASSSSGTSATTQAVPTLEMGSPSSEPGEEVPVSVDGVEIEGGKGSAVNKGGGNAELTFDLPSMKVPAFRKHIIQREAAKGGKALSYDEWKEAQDDFINNPPEEEAPAESTENAPPKKAAQAKPKNTSTGEEPDADSGNEETPEETGDADAAGETKKNDDTENSAGDEIPEPVESQLSAAPDESTTPPLIPEANQPAIASAMSSPSDREEPTGLGSDIGGSPPEQKTGDGGQKTTTPQQTPNEQEAAAQVAQQRSEESKEDKDDDAAENMKVENPLASDDWVRLFVATHPMYQRFVTDKTFPLKKGITLMEEARIFIAPLYLGALFTDVITTLTTISGLVPVVGFFIAAVLAIPVIFFYWLFGKFLTFTKSGVLAKVEDACQKAKKKLEDTLKEEKKKRTLVGKAKTAVANTVSRLTQNTPPGEKT